MHIGIYHFMDFYVYIYGKNQVSSIGYQDLGKEDFGGVVNLATFALEARTSNLPATILILDT